jgi:acyl carrier protein
LGQLRESDVDDAIRRILAEHSRVGEAAVSIDRTANLFDAGLDSVAAVNVMLASEEAFAFEFPQANLNRASFASISAIVAVIQKAAAPC